MTKLELIDVIRIAKEFSETAGWGWFRVVNTNWNEESEIWEVTAYTGVSNKLLFSFEIDDEKGTVTHYTSKQKKKE